MCLSPVGGSGFSLLLFKADAEIRMHARMGEDEQERGGP